MEKKERCVRDCGEMVRNIQQRCVLIDGIAAKKVIRLLLLVPFLVSHVLYVIHFGRLDKNAHTNGARIERQ